MWQKRQWQPVIDPLTKVAWLGGGGGRTGALFLRGCQVVGGGWRVALWVVWLLSWHRHRNQHVCGKPRISNCAPIRCHLHCVLCMWPKPVCRGPNTKCPQAPLALHLTPFCSPPPLAARFHSSTTNCCMQPPVVNLFTYLFTARDVRVSVGFVIKKTLLDYSKT